VVFDATHVTSDAASLVRFTSTSFDYRKEVILDSPDRRRCTKRAAPTSSPPTPLSTRRP